MLHAIHATSPAKPSKSAHPNDAPASDATAGDIRIDARVLLLRIQDALSQALSASRLAGSPPRLAAAVRHAVFPGGGRVRPLLSLSVAVACGDEQPALADAGAAAVELIHCASLVHDDLPCFDDAVLRRGRSTVHRAFGEPLAVLAGDALIVHAFDLIAQAGVPAPTRALAMTRALVGGLGMPDGIIGGQAWESEPRIDTARYHDAKTGALFVAALSMGAIAGGGDPAAWRDLGRRLGAAYQLADDLHDLVGGAAAQGKPVGQDARLGRPNAASELGVEGALLALNRAVADACDAVPACPGRDGIIELVQQVASRLSPAPAPSTQAAR